jgi:hypothetical protein
VAAIGANVDQRTHPQDNFDRDSAIQTYQTLIREWPGILRHLLFYLLDLLAVFVEESERSKMSASKLAAIFQPAILSHPEHTSSIADRQLSQDVLQFLIGEKDKLLVGTVVSDADRRAAAEAQEGSVVPAQIAPSSVVTGDGESRSVISDPNLPVFNTAQGSLSNISGPINYTQALHFTTGSRLPEL